MKFFILTVFVISNSLYAKEDTQNLMKDVLNSVISLTPYMSDEFKFSHPDNEKKIKLYLNRLKNSFNQANHLRELKQSNFAPSFKIITDQINQTIDSFDHHNKPFAQMRLTAMTSLCLSCHTQISKEKSTNLILSQNTSSRQNFSSDYEYANFLFLIRNYKKASSYYQNAISVHLKKVSEHKKVNNILGNSYETYDKKLIDSFKKLLTIYIKVLRKPQKINSILEQYSKDKNIPNYLEIQLNDWITKLVSILKDPALKSKLESEESVISYLNAFEKKISNASDTLRSKNFDLALLSNAGVLSNYLYSNPKTKLTPQILYWLGITENRLSKNLFFTLGDIYLKECITGYPKESIAQRCFQEYKDEIHFRYTGSLGTNIPKSKVLELQNLKKLIQN